MTQTSLHTNENVQHSEVDQKEPCSTLAFDKPVGDQMNNLDLS